MANPAGFDVKWNLTFSPNNNSSSTTTNTTHLKSNDPSHTDYREFQLFGRSPSTSPNLSNPPTSPLPERHPKTLDITAPVFVPKPPAPKFDPFNPDTSLDLHATNDDDVVELSDHLLSAQLLDDFDADKSDYNGTMTSPTTTTTTASIHHQPTMPWSSSLSTTTWSPVQSNSMAPTDNAAVKSIWGDKHVHDPMWWDRFEPYSHEDEKEFDPTLQYYQGSLLDSDTIQDMNKLSLSVTNPSMEEQQAENVGEDMSALQMLESIFTDLNEAELTATLEEHGYDLDKTTEALFNRKQQQQNESVQSASTETTTVTMATAPVKKRQVCRHFLAGECYRKDCWFAHDLQVKVCKFWLQGSCLKGDYCEFSHHIDVQEVASKIKSTPQQQSTKPVRFDESEYPDLQSSCNKPKGPTIQSATPTLVQEDFPTLGTAIKIKQPAKKTSSSPPSASINFAEAAKRKVNVKQATKPKKTMSNVQDARIMQRLKQPVNIPWLMTGSSLNKEYMKQRDQAIQYGMLRNRFFSRATAFYLEGDGAKAKAYSNQAKYYNRLMQEMHTEASRRIFEGRNQHEAFVDLHGLHIDEALDMIHERLGNLKGYEGIVYIITGTGHHSGTSGYSNKKSKLKPSVEEYLRQENYRFAETSLVNDDKGGIFAVDMTSVR
ncbi:hypothetical protein K492DRAFT_161061 [Lichtheimia hyalospora FSU 10163]|nr:hypothetical protein K492DRAFT_161061 [Lichtheimia hyalospora FSU 10163]